MLTILKKRSKQLQEKKKRSMHQAQRCRFSLFDWKTHNRHRKSTLSFFSRHAIFRDQRRVKLEKVLLEEGLGDFGVKVGLFSHQLLEGGGMDISISKIPSLKYSEIQMASYRERDRSPTFENHLKQFSLSQA